MFKYIELAKVLREVVDRGQQLKSVLYNSKLVNQKRIPMAYSLLSLALNNLPALQDAQRAIAQKQGLTINNPYLMCVMIAEFINTGSVQGGGQLKRVILQNKHLIPPIQKTSKINKQTVQVRIRATAHEFEQAKAKLKELGKADRIIPNMFHLQQEVYSALTKNQQFNLLSSSACVMQSFSSALPPFLLLKGINKKLEGKQLDIIDACSAPGNKTIQLEEYVNSRGKVFAFEKSPQRFQLLRKTLRKYQAANVEPKNADFLEIRRKDYRNVKFILLDPSCSGSGMLTNFLRDGSLLQGSPGEHFEAFCRRRFDQLDEKQQQRVEKLHSFQVELLSHAATFQPHRISYSTCSIYRRQNEDVIDHFLKHHQDYCLKNFRSKNQLLKQGFGQATRACVRIDPRSMQSDGFFVAILIRRKAS